MNGVLVLALAVPLVGAVATVVLAGKVQWAATAAALSSAAAWIVIAASARPPELGRITVDPALAAALAGLGLLVAVRRAAPTLSVCAGLSSITLFAATAGSGGEGLPDRPLAAGLLAVGLLTVLRLRVEGHRRPIPVVALVAGAALVAAGSAGSDPATAGLAVVAGAGVMSAATLANPLAGALVMPAVLLVMSRVVPAAIAADPTVSDQLSYVAGSAAAVIAGAIGWHVRRASALPGTVGVAAAMAAVVLFTVDLPGSRTAGLLVAVGAVAGFVVSHPLGLVALMPGTLAAIETLGAGSEPEHAAAGAALVALAVAGGIRLPASEPVDRAWTAHWPTALAVAFGVVPLWGWAGASLGDHVRAVSAAAAFGLPFAVGASALALHRGHRQATTSTPVPTSPAPTPPVPAPAVSSEVPPVESPVSSPVASSTGPDAGPSALTTAPTRSTGRIRARRSRPATPDGSSHQDLPLEAEGNDVVVEGPPAS